MSVTDTSFFFYPIYWPFHRDYQDFRAETLNRMFTRVRSSAAGKTDNAHAFLSMMEYIIFSVVFFFVFYSYFYYYYNMLFFFLSLVFPSRVFYILVSRIIAITDSCCYTPILYYAPFPIYARLLFYFFVTFSLFLKRLRSPHYNNVL